MSLKMLVRSFLGTLFQLHTRSFQSFYKKHEIFVGCWEKIFPPIFTRFGVHLSLLTRPISEPSDWASSDLEYIHRVRRNSTFKPQM